jgi:hypothetical protein
MYDGLLLEVFGASKKVLCVGGFQSKRGFCNFQPARSNVCVCVYACTLLVGNKQWWPILALEEKLETLVK